MVRPSTLQQVTSLLQRDACGLGLTPAQIRARYPGEVRRTSILEALGFLEELRVVQREGQHVRWIGPLPEGARPLGVDLRRLERDLAVSPQERVARMTRLSATLMRRPASGGAS